MAEEEKLVSAKISDTTTAKGHHDKSFDDGNGPKMIEPEEEGTYEKEQETTIHCYVSFISLSNHPPSHSYYIIGVIFFLFTVKVKKARRLGQKILRHLPLQ